MSSCMLRLSCHSRNHHRLEISKPSMLALNSMFSNFGFYFLIHSNISYYYMLPWMVFPASKQLGALPPMAIGQRLKATVSRLLVLSQNPLKWNLELYSLPCHCRWCNCWFIVLLSYTAQFLLVHASLCVIATWNHDNLLLLFNWFFTTYMQAITTAAKSSPYVETNLKSADWCCIIKCTILWNMRNIVIYGEIREILAC